ncbi:competence/damage-inducible protein A [Rubeoparvulum massiliense]|uniref:competence/damage-inducible protein A n=1 Tax=Rubeoparvulum massiliense TaxID=1631346 RepID=UPI00065DC551|nr:competence/damage-inducible protein A [Rubeoparvulum massiliense]
MKGEIIAVGSELLLGQIANTNAQFISQQCALHGIPIYYHTVVGDNAQRLRQVILTAQKRSDVIIFTGGLGPTQDDLTKEIVAEVLGLPLQYDKETEERITSYFQKTGRPMTPNNRKQALTAKDTTVFLNNHGLACGMGLEINGIRYALLPGPPREMKPMFMNSALPFLLQQEENGVVHSHVLRFFGIGESQLETELQDLISIQTNPTLAPLANDGEVKIRLTASAASIDEAERLMAQVEQEIIRRVGVFLYSAQDEDLAEVVIHQLAKKGRTLAVAESCTGGLLAEMLTNIPGSSEVFQGGFVCYTNQVKERICGVPAEILQVHGAVSAETAATLAENTCKLLQVDYALAITGVAGPAPSENKDPGLVYVGLAQRGKMTTVNTLHLAGVREEIRIRAAKHALSMVLQASKTER